MSTPNAHAWVKRVEAEYGQPVEKMLQDAANTAKATGYSMRDVAREWGVCRKKLEYYCIEKLGIHFPRGASALQKAKATAQARKNAVSGCKYWITVDGQRRTLSSECKRRGRDYSTVRLLMQRYGLTAEEAINRPSMPRGERNTRGRAAA